MPDTPSASVTTTCRSTVRAGLLFGIVIYASIGYLAYARRLHSIAENDGAYYYGVARHMVLTGRFEEPLVWHFLAPPATIVHAPFDYWGPLTSLALVPGLVIFGVNPESAFLTMALLSISALVLYWYLVSFVLGLRHWAAGLLAITLFAFSPALVEYRFQPESIAVAHVFLLAALIAFYRQRLVTTIVLAFCIFLTRGDGLIIFALVSGAVLVTALRSPTLDSFWRSVLVLASCGFGYMLWSRLSFGTLTPPGPQTLPFLRSYWEVFAFGAPHGPSVDAVWRRFTWSYLLDRKLAVHLMFLWCPFTPFPRTWLAGSFLLGGLALFERRWSRLLLWLLCFGGLLGLLWVSGEGFNAGRTPATFTPLVILVGAAGLDDILLRFQSWAVRNRRSALWRLGMNLAALAACTILLRPLIPPRMPATEVMGKHSALAALDKVLRGQPVATNQPWYMMAYTNSPVVSIPFNGEDAIAAVIDRYRIEWIVIFGPPPWGVLGPSASPLDDILRGRRVTLGRFHLALATTIDGAAVYRLSSIADVADS